MSRRFSFHTLFVAMVVSLLLSPASAQSRYHGTEDVSRWLAAQAHERLVRLIHGRKPDLRRALSSALADVSRAGAAADRPPGDPSASAQMTTRVVRRVYRETRGRTVFVVDGRMTEAGEALQALLMSIERHGVASGPYALAPLAELLRRFRASESVLERPTTSWAPPPGWTPPDRPPYSAPLKRALADVDRNLQRHLALIDSVDVRLTVDAARLFHDMEGLPWRRSRDIADRVIALARRPQKVLREIIPQHPQYARLGQALARYLALWRGPAPEKLPDGAPLVVSDRSAVVSMLRRRLFWEGFVDEPVGGEYNAELVAAVRRFQYTRGLPETGQVDGPTRIALNRPIEWWVKRLILGLERWRRSPVSRYGDTYIRVNIPAYELVVWLDGEPKMRQRVFVGKASTPTPTLVSKLRQIRVNPQWNVPPGVQRREIEPRAKRDPDFLAREGFVRRGRRARTRYIQRPGPRNWLGRAIFSIYNTHNIALHGTVRRHLFDDAQRTYSNGCVDMKDEIGLLRLLLAHDRNPAASLLDSWLTSWRPKRVRLRRAVPVIIEYQTTVVDGDGAVRFLRDPYRKDGRALVAIDLDGFTTGAVQ